MTFYQRLSGFIYAILSLFNIFMSISIFAFPIVLIMGKQLVAYSSEEQFRWLIRLCFMTLFLNRLTDRRICLFGNLALAGQISDSQTRTLSTCGPDQSTPMVDPRPPGPDLYWRQLCSWIE